MAKRTISLSIEDELLRKIEDTQKKERRGSFSEMASILIEDGFKARDSQSQE